MIRRVELQDAKAITTIYNEYVRHSVATFETEPLREEDMRNRIAGIAVRFPYFVYTLETTVYLAPGYEGKGIGRELMERLIEECRRDGYRALIACVTEGNVVSDALHLRLGFKKVSHFKKVGLKFGRWLDVVDYELLLS